MWLLELPVMPFKKLNKFSRTPWFNFLVIMYDKLYNSFMSLNKFFKDKLTTKIPIKIWDIILIIVLLVNNIYNYSNFYPFEMAVKISFCVLS